MIKQLSDYEQVKKDLNLNNNEISTHETDLYIKFTPKRIKYFQDKGFYPLTFISQIDGELWIEQPFYLIDDKIRGRN